MNRAKYTFWQVVGVVLILTGLGGIGSQLVPRSDAVAPVPLSQLGLAEDHAERAAVVAQGLPKFLVVGADGQDNTLKNVRLWDAMLAVRGSHLPNIPQQIGDCVSWGAAHAVDYLQAVQMVRGPPGEFQFKEAYPPYIYGVSRVLVGRKHGSNFRGDGSVGAYAAEGLRDYGVLRSDADQVPPYSGAVAKQWGNSGPPEWAVTTGKPFAVKTIAQVNSAAEARDAIVNGYPVTIASGWWGTTKIDVVDGRRLATRNTSWGHQQCLIGYDGSSRGGPYFYCLNSWGDNAHPLPLQGEPPGGYWIRFSDVDHICREGDSWALSGFDGFPADQINWDQLLRRAQPIMSVGQPADVPQISLEGIMNWPLLALMLLAVVAGVALFSWARTAGNRIGIAMMTIGTLLYGGNVNAQQPDFAAAANRSTVALNHESPAWGLATSRAAANTVTSPVPQPPKIHGEVWHDATVRRPVGERATVVIASPPDYLARTEQLDTRPYMVLYAPDYCPACPGMQGAVGSGDKRIRLRWVKGRESDFPDFVRKYIAQKVQHVYPVEHWVSPTGKPAIHHGIRTLDNLVELVKTEPE